jgi:hypothetical protein
MRHTKQAAKARSHEDEARARNFKEAQDQCPTETLIEIASSTDVLRTVKRLNLFDGPWLHCSPVTVIQVWQRKEGTMRPCGNALTDQSGMLDTARYALWANINSQEPSPHDPTEQEVLRKARAWHKSTNTNEKPHPNLEKRAEEGTETRGQKIRPAEHHYVSPRKSLPPPLPPKRTNKPQESKLLNATLPHRQAEGDRILAAFDKAVRPRSITPHLCSRDDAAELS